MSGSRSVNDDELVMQINGTRYGGWLEWTVMAGIENVPRSFTVALAGGTPESVSRDIKPGDACSIKLGNDLLINGWIGGLYPAIDGRTHTVKIVGSSRFVDFIESTVPVEGNPQITNSTLPQIAERLAAPHSLAVNLSEPESAIIPMYAVTIGQTCYDVIEEIARYRGFLVYDSVNGDIEISRVGATRHAGSIIQGTAPIIAANLIEDQTKRFHTVNVYWQSIDGLSNIAQDTNVHGTATDGAIRANRILDIVSNQLIDGIDVGQLRADFEVNRRIGRGFVITVKLIGYRDAGNQIWTPNKIVNVRLPFLKAPNTDMLIANCVYEMSEHGSTTTLTLMPPAAFTPAPTALQQQLNPGLARALAETRNLPEGTQGSNQ